MSIASSANASPPARQTLWHIITAISVTVLVAGELQVVLTLGEWAIARFLGLPDIVTIALYAISALGSFAIAIVLFVRVMRTQARHAANQPIDDIGWHPFAPNGHRPVSQPAEIRHPLPLTTPAATT